MAIATGTGLALAAAGTVAGAAISANATKKAAESAANAAKGAQVDITALDQQAREIALRNAQDSAALEKALTPEVPVLRQQSNLAVLNGLQPNAQQQSAVNQLYSRLGSDLNTPLLQDAIAKARSDLALGGQLSLSQRNEVARAAGAKTGGSLGGLGLARDVSARDLGLTSYGVEQQRLQNAANLGGLELNSAKYNADNFLSGFNALQNYYNTKNAYALGAAQYGNSIAPPVVGLDPSTVGGIAVGNSNIAANAGINAAAIKAQQGQTYANLGGQLLGLGLAYNASNSGGSGITAGQLAF